MDTPAMTVVVPTHGRPGYLEVTLDSLRRQSTRAPYEILVVDDGGDPSTPELAERFGARLVRHPEHRGANPARNTGIRESEAPLLVFIDDDICAPPGWLEAIAEGAERHPDAEAFGGPIRPRLEGRAPRSCGREEPPVTSLDLGPEDTEAEMAWGANMAVRRSAFERIGGFDDELNRTHGDEEDWIMRLRAGGGRLVYLADAGLDHRRTARDSRLRALARAAYHRGRAARGTDRYRGSEPSLVYELRVLVGCGWHTIRRACPQGVIMGAHSAGRIAEALRPR